MHRLGVHGPNLQWRRWPASFLRLCQRLQPSAVVLLAYEESAATAGHHEDARQLAAMLPGVRLLVRCYGPGEWQRDPADWAEECAWRMDRYQGLNAECIPANEGNLESGLSWDEQAEWLRRFAASFYNVLPSVPLHVPALAPKGQYWAGYGVYKNSGVFSQYDIADCHVYFGDFNQRDAATLASLSGRSVDVTEFHSWSAGDFEDPGPWLRGLPRSVRSASWFIADSDDSTFDYCNLAKQPAAVELLARYVEGQMTDEERALLNQVYQQNANLYQAMKALLQDKVADAETWTKANNMTEAATWHRKADVIFPK